MMGNSLVAKPAIPRFHDIDNPTASVLNSAGKSSPFSNWSTGRMAMAFELKMTISSAMGNQSKLLNIPLATSVWVKYEYTTNPKLLREIVAQARVYKIFLGSFLITRVAKNPDVNLDATMNIGANFGSI